MNIRLIEVLNEIQIDIASMKVDLAHHIRRSDAHDSDIAHLMKVKYMIYGALTFLSVMATILGIYNLIK